MMMRKGAGVLVGVLLAAAACGEEPAAKEDPASRPAKIEQPPAFLKLAAKARGLGSVYIKVDIRPETKDGTVITEEKGEMLIWIAPAAMKIIHKTAASRQVTVTDGKFGYWIRKGRGERWPLSSLTRGRGMLDLLGPSGWFVDAAKGYTAMMAEARFVPAEPDREHARNAPGAKWFRQKLALVYWKGMSVHMAVDPRDGLPRVVVLYLPQSRARTRPSRQWFRIILSCSQVRHGKIRPGDLKFDAEEAKVEWIDLVTGKKIDPPKSVIADSAAAAGRAREEGFVSLFDGKTLTGWVGATKGYAAEDGKIVCLKKGGGNLYTAKQYGDFVLRFDFKLEPGTNNGLGIRTPLKGNPAYVGMELQILDNTAEKWSKLKPYQYHGSIYGVVPAKRGHLKPVGQWNSQEVTCRGRRVKVVLNGVTIVDADLDKAAAGGTLDGRKHPGLKRARGHIGFLGHGSRVEFRNIRIRELSGPG